MNTSAALHVPFHRQLCLAQHHTTVQSLRSHLGLSMEEELILHRGSEEIQLADDGQIELIEHDRLSCRHRHHPVTVHINGAPFHFEDPRQSGRSLKERAGIDLRDALSQEEAGGESIIIANDQEVCLHTGECFISQPGADYGSPSTNLALPTGARLVPQADGWMHVILPRFQLPQIYRPDVTDILVKLPPTFPDAAPDMFWVRPHVTLANGGLPQATSDESIGGEVWQRFSWHLRPGVWKPGVSTFADFVRCIRGRFAAGT